MGSADSPLGLDAGSIRGDSEPENKARVKADERGAPPKQLARRQPAGANNRNEESPAKRPGRGRELVPDSLPAAGRRIEQRLRVVEPPSGPIDKNTAQFALPPLPSGAASRSYGTLIGFVLCVVLPVVFASIYYVFIASNQYVSEFRFTVKDASSSANPSTSGLAALAGSFGSGGGSSTENYIVADFLTSREAVELLRKRIDVVGLYSKPGVDWWSRFNASRPLEKFVQFWQQMVNAHYDPVTGIATATVRAFSPQDSLAIANVLVSLSEELVNQMASRSQRDNVRFAEAEVERAQERLKTVQASMTEYRNRVGVIDPNTSVVASNSTLVQTLQSNLSQLQTQLDVLKRQKLDANAPAMVTLKNQINSVQSQLGVTEAAVGKSHDGKPLSTVMGEYEQLNLERQFAQTMLTSTMQALDQARASAAAQHLYITPYVRPSLPQSSTYPRRLLSIAGIGALSFALWLIGLLLLRSIRERFA